MSADANRLAPRRPRRPRRRGLGVRSSWSPATCPSAELARPRRRRVQSAPTPSPSWLLATSVAGRGRWPPTPIALDDGPSGFAAAWNAAHDAAAAGQRRPMAARR